MARPTKATQQLNLKESIKNVAWQHIADVGAAGLSLRAIARDIGVSAPALYHYYADRDALITALISDAYTSLGDFQLAARDAVPATDLRGRLHATGVAYRAWALAMPQHYQLIFGTPIPGYQAPPEVMPVAGRSLQALVSVLDDLAHAGLLNTSAIPQANSSSLPMFAQWQHHTTTHHPAALTCAILIWGRVHGLVMLEITGAIPAFGTHGDGLHMYELYMIAKQFIKPTLSD